MEAVQAAARKIYADPEGCLSSPYTLYRPDGAGRSRIYEVVTDGLIDICNIDEDGARRYYGFEVVAGEYLVVPIEPKAICYVVSDRATLNRLFERAAKKGA